MAAHKMRPMKDKNDVLIGFDDLIYNKVLELEALLNAHPRVRTEQEILFFGKLAAALNNLHRAWRHISLGERYQFKDNSFKGVLDSVEANVRGACELLRREIERDRPDNLKGLPPFKEP